MNLKKIYFPTWALALCTLGSCGDHATVEHQQADSLSSQHAAPLPISIEPLTGSPEFPDAELKIKSVTAVPLGKDSATVTVQYEVKNYELKSQTSDAASKDCNNSKEGQHIHFILDNQPYLALYEPTKTFNVALGSEHYLMSFLSRSYHESLKTPKAGVLYRFSVSEKGKVSELELPKQPMVFYSRPKGDYVGGDTKNLLLDFYVYGATLGKDAKVAVDINGSAFEIDKWQPYFAHNVPMGEVAVKLQLTDMSGAPYSGPNTSVTRNIRLAESEPLP